MVRIVWISLCYTPGVLSGAALASRPAVAPALLSWTPCPQNDLRELWGDKQVHADLVLAYVLLEKERVHWQAWIPGSFLVPKTGLGDQQCLLPEASGGEWEHRKSFWYQWQEQSQCLLSAASVPGTWQMLSHLENEISESRSLRN